MCVCSCSSQSICIIYVLLCMYFLCFRAFSFEVALRPRLRIYLWVTPNAEALMPVAEITPKVRYKKCEKCSTGYILNVTLNFSHTA